MNHIAGICRIAVMAQSSTPAVDLTIWQRNISSIVQIIGTIIQRIRGIQRYGIGQMCVNKTPILPPPEQCR